MLILFLVLLNACASSQTEHDTFCVTRSGSKYHRCDCSYVKANSQKITHAEAVRQNYVACSVCRPDETLHDNPAAAPLNSLMDSQPKDSVKEKNDNKTNTRCTALTRSGKQCKRKASTGGEKCWQHKER